MYIATTTGTAGGDRVEHDQERRVRHRRAKACGIGSPTVGILNVDGARQVERALRRIAEAGYPMEFAESARADGGAIMRGNDLLMGIPDVMVTDTLTGNLLMKVFSSYTTGGDYEATGWGYGPGVGEGYSRIIMIVSRASGAPVIAGAVSYAAELARGGLAKVANDELAAARLAGWPCGREKATASAPSPAQGEITAPPAKVVTAEIAGVDILELDEAVRVLWAAGIYAETGMGCTGPIVMVALTTATARWSPQAGAILVERRSPPSAWHRRRGTPSEASPWWTSRPGEDVTIPRAICDEIKPRGPYMVV